MNKLASCSLSLLLICFADYSWAASHTNAPEQVHISLGSEWNTFLFIFKLNF